MGKGARERQRRATERPKLILPPGARRRQRTAAPSNEEAKPEPTGPTLAKCQVRGCPNPALERHDGPDGAVWLCGRCGEIARANLLDAEREERIKEGIAAMYREQAEYMLEHHSPVSLPFARR